MLLNSIKEKSDVHKKLNKNIILKKTLSELNIKVKNKRHNNILPINSLSTTNRYKKKEVSNLFNNILKRQNSNLSNSPLSSLLKKSAISTRNIFKKYMDKKLLTAKTAREMEDKFYTRYKEGANDLDKKFNLFNTVIKSHGKIVKKIFLDYKNIENYNKAVLSNSINNYKRNLEFIENQDKVKKLQVLKNSKKFEKLLNSHRKSLFSSHIKTPTESKRPSFFSTAKFKISPIKRVSIKNNNFNKLEEQVQEALVQMRYYRYKKLKNNAIKFCEQIQNIDKECKLYEPINKLTSKKNIQKNNYFNLSNLDRIIKLKCLKDDDYINEDYERNSAFLKKSFKYYYLYCDKAIAGYLPKFAKRGSFLPSTMKKFANLQGKYFGLPV